MFRRVVGRPVLPRLDCGAAGRSGDGDRPALVIGGTPRIRTGDLTAFCKVVAVAQARVRRDGRVQAQGSPAEHATLGPAEEWLDRQAGPG